ncbi:MAG: hypothetical protein ACYDG4_17920 [Desulfuromonadaceae bacterium]
MNNKEAAMKTGIFQEGRRFVVYKDGEVIKRANMRIHAENFFAKTQKGFEQVSVSVAAEVEPSKFHVNKRFQFLNKTVKMVAKGLQNSAVISGSGGLGKSYSVKKALYEAGLKDLSVEGTQEGVRLNRSKSFVVVKGYSTAKGLFRTIYESKDSVLVFDDCDSVLKDPVALNLLKGALDSYDTRIISWNADMRDDDLPKSFIYTGRIIFISNLPESKIDQAIRSRSAVIDVSMTTDEVVDRMGVMIEEDEFLPEFEKNIKVDALVFIAKMKTKMREINLRTLITVCKVRAADEDGTWAEMAEYLVCK